MEEKSSAGYPALCVRLASSQKEISREGCLRRSNKCKLEREGKRGTALPRLFVQCFVTRGLTRGWYEYVWEKQGLLINLSGGLRNRIPEFISRKGHSFLAYFPFLKYMVFQKELYNDIANVTVWRIILKLMFEK
jgi:hypothetical protein